MNLVRYTHVNQPRLRYTVAYSFKRDGENVVIDYGIAQCSKNDTFTRAEGRQVATGRLNKGVPSLRSGKLVVKDSEGLNVSSVVRKHFEANRRVVLNSVTAKSK